MDPARFIAALSCRWRNNFWPSSKLSDDPRSLLGQRGERIAARHLRQNGYKILNSNFRAPRGGEVDIVCRDKQSNTLVFVEVKTRASLRFGAPAEAVTPDKQKLISRGALAWLRLLDNPDVFFRFDIVEVVVSNSGCEINVIRDAFQLREPYIY
jgi:putative endonuclease